MSELKATRKKPDKRGPYRRKTSLIQYDHRTLEGRLMDQVRADLLSHLGTPTPSITQKALVERAVMLHLKISQLDKRLLAGTITGYDHDTYLAWCNSYRRVMVALSLEPAAANGAHTDPMEAIRRHIEGRPEAAD